jgi:beta-phosphoglucomutase
MSPNFPRKLAAVIFDLDGVLTDTASAHYRAWKWLADELGVPFDERANAFLKGIDRMRSLELLLGPTAHRYTDAEKRSLAERKNSRYVAEIVKYSRGDVFRGARRVLAEIKDAGLKLALASASRNAPLLLRRLDLEPCFDAIVDAATITSAKPDPEIFCRAAELLSVSPAECLAVEDATAGIAAIRKAGMWALGIGNPAELSEAHHVLEHISCFQVGNFVSAKHEAAACGPT